MIKLDLYWMSNLEWFTFTKKGAVIKPDAPQKAQESYQRYLEETKNLKILLPHEIYMPNSEEDFHNNSKRLTILE